MQDQERKAIFLNIPIAKSSQQTPRESKKNDDEDDTGLEDEIVRPSITISDNQTHFNASAMRVFGNSVLPATALKIEAKKIGESHTDYAARLAAGVIEQKSPSSTNVLNLIDARDAFHGIDDDKDEKVTDEPLFSKYSGVDCPIPEATIEVRRLYACLRWLLQTKNFEEELDEDTKENEQGIDTANSFLSHQREQQRWKKFVQRDATSPSPIQERRLFDPALKFELPSMQELLPPSVVNSSPSTSQIPSPTTSSPTTTTTDEKFTDHLIPNSPPPLSPSSPEPRTSGGNNNSTGGGTEPPRKSGGNNNSSEFMEPPRKSGSGSEEPRKSGSTLTEPPRKSVGSSGEPRRKSGSPGLPPTGDPKTPKQLGLPPSSPMTASRSSKRYSQPRISKANLLTIFEDEDKDKLDQSGSQLRPHGGVLFTFGKNQQPESIKATILPDPSSPKKSKRNLNRPGSADVGGEIFVDDVLVPTRPSSQSISLSREGAGGGFAAGGGVEMTPLNEIKEEKEEKLEKLEGKKSRRLIIDKTPSQNDIIEDVEELDANGEEPVDDAPIDPKLQRNWVSQVTLARQSRRSTVTKLGDDRIPTEIDPDTFRGAVSKELQINEEKFYRKVWRELGHSEKSTQGGHHPVLSAFENRSYQSLMVVLERLTKTGELNAFVQSKFSLQTNKPTDFGRKDKRVVVHCIRIINYLREAEMNPRSWHLSGFLNKIDNYVAVLLYRRYKNLQRDEIKEPEKKMHTTLPNTAKYVKIFAALQPQTCPTFFQYVPASLVLLLLLAGIVGEWAVSHFQTELDYSYCLDAFSQETSQRIQLIVNNYFQTAINVAMLQTAYYYAGVYNFTSVFSNDSNIDRYLVDSLLYNNISSFTLATDQGLYLRTFYVPDDANFRQSTLLSKKNTNNNQDSISIVEHSSFKDKPRPTIKQSNMFFEYFSSSSLDSSSPIFLDVIDSTTKNQTTTCLESYTIQLPLLSPSINLRANSSKNSPTCPAFTYQQDLRWYNKSKTSANWTNLYPLLTPSDYSSSPTVWGTTYFRSIYDLEGNFIGSYGIDLSLSLLSLALSDLQLSNNAIAYLIDTSSLTSTKDIPLSSSSSSSSSSSQPIFLASNIYNPFKSPYLDMIRTSEQWLQNKAYTSQTYPNTAYHEIVGDYSITVRSFPVNLPPSSSSFSSNLSSSTTWLSVIVLPIDNFTHAWLVNDIGSLFLVVLLAIAAIFISYYAFRKQDIVYITGQPYPMQKQKSVFREPKRVQSGQLSQYTKTLAKLIIVFISTLFMVLGIYFVWFNNGPDLINTVNQQALNNFHLTAQRGIIHFLTDLTRITDTSLDLWDHHDFHPESSLSSNLTNTYPWSNQTYDQYFYHLINSYLPPDSLDFPSGMPLASQVYVGFENGDFAGAEAGVSLYHNELSDNTSTSTYPILITVKDNLTQQCYSKYKAIDKIGLRNTSNLLWRSGNCSFDPRDRSWYQNAVAAGKPTWSSIYPFTPSITDLGADSEADSLGANDLGITRSVPFYKRITLSNGTVEEVLAGVLGVDFSLSIINQWLQYKNVLPWKGGSIGSTKFFILERSTGLLVGTSSSSPEYLEFMESLPVPVLGTNAADDDEVQSISGYFTLPPNNLMDVKDSPKTRRSLDFPWLNIMSIKDTEHGGLDWVSVLVELPPKGLYGSKALSDLLSIGILAMFLWLTARAVHQIRRKWLTTKDHHDNALKALGGRNVQKKDLVVLLKTIRPLILKAANNSIESPTNSLEPWELIEFDSISDHYQNMAAEHIFNCAKKRNILTLAALHDFTSTLPRKVYILYTSGTYKFFIHAVLVLHIGLYFAEPQTPTLLKQDGNPPWVIAIEALCIFLEVADITMKFVMTFLWKLDNILSPKGEDIDIVIRATLTVAIWLNWLITTSARISFEFYLPIRPFLLLFKNSYLRKAAFNFIKTLSRAWDVFLFFLAVIVCSGFMGVLLYRGILNNDSPDGTATYEFVPGPSFQHIFSAITLLAVYCTTAENLPDFIYIVFNVSPWNVIYLMVVFCISIYFGQALFVGAFQDGFLEARERVLQKRALFKRTGLVSAFCLLDLNCHSVITRQQFERFVFRLAPHLEEHRASLDMVYLVLRKNDYDTVDISEFVQGIEMLALGKRKFKSRIAPWRLTLQAFFDRDWLRTVITAAIFLHLLVVCLYGSYQNEAILDSVQAVIFAAYVVEITVKLIAFTPSKFWNSAYYLLEHQSHSWLAKAKKLKKVEPKEDDNPGTPTIRRRVMAADNDPSRPTVKAGKNVTVLTSSPQSASDYEEMEAERKKSQADANLLMFAHRFELVLVAGSGITIGLLLLVTASGVTIAQDYFRFLLAFSILRIFAMFQRLRRLTYTLFKSWPSLWPILTILTLIFIEYAIVGVALFAGKFQTMASAGFVQEGPTCDYFGICLLLLFQLFTGQSWQNLLDAGIASYGWSATLFFISFVVLCSLLIGQGLLTAFFLEASKEDKEDAPTSETEKKSK